MPWNPEVYNQFKDIRFQPFFDLTALINEEESMKRAIDIGCGTGEQTAILSNTFPNTLFLGIDASKEMLAKSEILQNQRLHFRQETTEAIISSSEKWDLIFSNAALQWSDNHRQLFPGLIDLLNPKGQFAVQMPGQPDNILNQILFELVQEEPFYSYLKGWKRSSPILDLDTYAQLLFDSGLHNIQIMQKVYPIIANDVQELFDFISGSSLIPYIERLEDSIQKDFTDTFKKRIASKFPKFPAIYAFKRLLLYGQKK